MNNECPICWVKLKGINYYYLPCNHLICQKCYIIFIKQYTRCCLCRSHFRPCTVKLIKFVPKRHGKIWTTIEEFKLIDLYLDSKRINDIAFILQRTEKAIVNKINKLRTSEIIKLDELRRQRIENRLEEERIMAENLLTDLRYERVSIQNPNYGYYFAFSYIKIRPLFLGLLVGYGFFIYSRFASY